MNLKQNKNIPGGLLADNVDTDTVTPVCERQIMGTFRGAVDTRMGKVYEWSQYKAKGTYNLPLW